MTTIGKFATPTVVYHGPGALARLRDEIAKAGSESPCLVTDEGLTSAGIPDQVYQVLGREIPSFNAVEPEPRYTMVDDVTAFLRSQSCDLVIGLGGGSVMDAAKTAAAMMANSGKVPEYFGADKLPKAGIPFIAVPTTAGTGSEVSPAAVFIDPRDQRKTGVRSDLMLAKAAILDPVLTLSLPQALTASTGMDALTHAIECYTARAATTLSDMVCERAIQMIAEHLPVAVANGSDIEARDGMLMASYLAGLSLSIANVGAVHALAQTLGGIYKVRHGVANSLFLPYVMAYNRIGCRRKYAKVAELMGEPVHGLSLDAASEAAVDAVRRLSLSIGIPQRLRDINVPEDGLETVSRRCMETQGRIAGNNPRTMNEADALAILREAY